MMLMDLVLSDYFDDVFNSVGNHYKFFVTTNNTEVQKEFAHKTFA